MMPQDEDFQETLDNFLDGRWKGKTARGPLPWSADMTIESDQRLCLQVDAIEFHEEVRVQIWKESELLMEYVITNGALPPPLISFSP